MTIHKRFPFMIWLLILTFLLTALAGCGNDSEEADRLAALKQENAQLKEQIAAMEARLNELESSGLKTWKLSADAWPDNLGASVHFQAEPRAHADSQGAMLNVRLNGEEIISLACTWDGTAYTATADLPAADGYSYSCVLIAPDGTREQIPLSSPDNPIYDTLVNIESSLIAYCNLFVADWSESEGMLNITAGYVQVQLPQITAAGTEVDYQNAQLVFCLNGNAIETQTLDLPKGEGEGSYETALTSVSFHMPEMEDDYQLDLYLNVNLTNGETISAGGGSWYYNNETLNMLVG